MIFLIILHHNVGKIYFGIHQNVLGGGRDYTVKIISITDTIQVINYIRFFHPCQ